METLRESHRPHGNHNTVVGKGSVPSLEDYVSQSPPLLVKW